MKTIPIALAILGAFFGSLTAQVPQLLNFQGRVTVDGMNFDGTGQFKFSLVDAAGTTTYWSNDGNGTAGSEPTLPVPLTVTKGLYSVLLGNTTVPNMTAVPASVFANDDVRLRVWFDDGSNGSQLLTPDQRIAAVGYAMMAGAVPDGAITSAQLAPALDANLAKLDGSATFAGTVTAGSFAGGGAGLTGVPGTLQWQPVSGGTVQAQANHSYAATSDDGQVVIALPADLAAGDVIRVSGVGSGGWRLAQNEGQSIRTDTLFEPLWIPRESPRPWSGVASSADGTKLVAVVNSGRIHTSFDSGETWIPRMADTDRFWSGVASSADGTKLVAVITGQRIYTSTDSGETWTPRMSDTTRAWRCVASSSDGTKLVAAVDFNGRIFTSTDSGETWTERSSAGNRHWKSVASSSDGTKLVAVADSGQIHTSTDSGETWTPRDLNRNWRTVASSADGSKLAATVEGGFIYTSIDSGETWTARMIDANRTWHGIASSADGAKLVATVSGGRIHTSVDSGLTWRTRETTRNWRAVASSSDGTRLLAGGQHELLYTVDLAGTTAEGAAGFLSGGQNTSVELQYLGDGVFAPVAYSGSLGTEAGTAPGFSGVEFSVDQIPLLDASKIVSGDLQAERLKVGTGHTLTGTLATIAGGTGNTASGSHASVAGGFENSASTSFSSVAGGSGNTASGIYSTVPGGSMNTADGSYSFAAGRRAKANHQGAFVWADNTNADFQSTTTNEFAIRAANGLRLVGGSFIGDGSGLTGIAPAEGSIGTLELADNAVTSLQLADGSVETTKLANNAVTSAKLAGQSVGTSQLANAAVTTLQLADGSVTNAKLADNSVTSAKLAGGSVGSSQLANASVTTLQLADGSVTTVKLANSAVTSAKLADGSVTTVKLANSAVTSAKLANASVASANMASNSVISAKLANDAASLGKITGDVIRSASGRIGIGTGTPETPLHVLTSLANDSFHNAAIYGRTTSTVDFNTVGVQGETTGSAGRGVFGWASHTSGNTHGVYGHASSTAGTGVRGEVTATSGTNYGVRGLTYSTGGTGIRGEALAGSGTNYGVYGTTDSAAGYGGYFVGRGYFSQRLGVGMTPHASYRLALPNTASDAGRGVANSWDTYSSGRWKENVRTLEDPLDKVLALRGVRYDWTEQEEASSDIGFIAEEVGRILPEIVTFEAGGEHATAMDYSRLTPLLVEAIKAQQGQITELTNRLERLERELASDRTDGDNP